MFAIYFHTKILRVSIRCHQNRKPITVLKRETKETVLLATIL